MRMCLKKIAVLTLIGMTSLLAACGDSDQVEVSAAVKGLGEKVRYMVIGASVRGLDPAGIGDTTSSGIGGQIYETLYQYHYLKRPYEVVPLLARAMPQVSDDGKTVTIKLKKGVKFQDDPAFPNGEGREMVAADVIYSWKRLADLTANLQTDNWWVFDGYIVGLNAFRDYTSNLGKGEKADYGRRIEGLKAIDDYTIRIKLNKPFPQLKYILAHLPTAVVPREVVEKYGQDFINHPVGTGPFLLKQWDRGEQIVLGANPDYRQEPYPSQGEPGDQQNGLLDDAGKPLPLLDGVHIRIIKEDQPAWLLFMDEKLDASGIPKDNFGQAITQSRSLTDKMKDKGIRLVKFQTPATYWYGINMKDPVLGENLPLRQAMNAAFDRKRYLDLFLNNRGQPAHGFLPPVMPAYNDDLKSPYTHYDVDKARKLAKKAKNQYRDKHGKPLPKITLTVGRSTPTSRQQGQFISRLMQDANIPFEVNYTDWPTLQTKVKNASVQMFGMGWVADYPEAGNFMTIYYGPNHSPGPNSVNYDNPKFNTLFKQAKTVQDAAKRRRMYAKMEQMVVDDLPFLLQAHGESYILLYPWLENYKPTLYGSGYMKYLDINVEMRRKRVGR